METCGWERRTAQYQFLVYMGTIDIGSIAEVLVSLIDPLPTHVVHNVGLFPLSSNMPDCLDGDLRMISKL